MYVLAYPALVPWLLKEEIGWQLIIGRCFAWKCYGFDDFQVIEFETDVFCLVKILVEDDFNTRWWFQPV